MSDNEPTVIRMLRRLLATGKLPEDFGILIAGTGEPDLDGTIVSVPQARKAVAIYDEWKAKQVASP